MRAGSREPDSSTFEILPPISTPFSVTGAPSATAPESLKYVYRLVFDRKNPCEPAIRKTRTPTMNIATIASSPTLSCAHVVLLFPAILFSGYLRCSVAQEVAAHTGPVRPATPPRCLQTPAAPHS